MAMGRERKKSHCAYTTQKNITTEEQNFSLVLSSIHARIIVTIFLLCRNTGKYREPAANDKTPKKSKLRLQYLKIGMFPTTRTRPVCYFRRKTFHVSFFPVLCAIIIVSLGRKQMSKMEHNNHKCSCNVLRRKVQTLVWISIFVCWKRQQIKMPKGKKADQSSRL